MAETSTQESELYYTPIDIREQYNKRKFDKAKEELSNLEQALLALRQDPFNPRIRQGLGAILFQNPEHFAGIAPDVVRMSSESAMEKGRTKLEEYAINNADILLSEINPENYFTLLTSLPIKESGNEKDSGYNEFVKAVNELNEFSKLAENSRDDPSAKRKLADEIKKDFEWGDNWIPYAMNDSNYFPRLVKASLIKRNIAVDKLIAGEDGTPDEEKVRAYFTESYRIAKENRDKDYFRGIIKAIEPSSAD